MYFAIAKKLKMRSQERKNVVLGKLLRKKNQKGARV